MTSSNQCSAQMIVKGRNLWQMMCTWEFSSTHIPTLNKCWLNKCSGGSRISRKGDVDLVVGGVDSRGSYVSRILYVKTKESWPLGGRAPGTPPSRSANEVWVNVQQADIINNSEIVYGWIQLRMLHFKVKSYFEGCSPSTRKCLIHGWPGVFNSLVQWRC